MSICSTEHENKLVCIIEIRHCLEGQLEVPQFTRDELCDIYEYKNTVKKLLACVFVLTVCFYC